MKKIIFLLIILLVTNANAFNSYSASYILSAGTVVGEFQIGTVILDLKRDENHFTYTSEATTDSILKALYDYSRIEKSTGYFKKKQLISNYFSVIEKEKNKIKKNFEIITFPDKSYALSSAGKKWKINQGSIVDPLSVYLALSTDMFLYPNKKDFIYQVVDEDGVKNLSFKVDGPEIIQINEDKIITIRVLCDELRLTINLAFNDNLQPIKIQKINGKTKFTMLLEKFKD
jgi:hypothetical protein